MRRERDADVGTAPREAEPNHRQTDRDVTVSAPPPPRSPQTARDLRSPRPAASHGTDITAAGPPPRPLLLRRRVRSVAARPGTRTERGCAAARERGQRSPFRSCSVRTRRQAALPVTLLGPLSSRWRSPPDGGVEEDGGVWEQTGECGSRRARAVGKVTRPPHFCWPPSGTAGRARTVAWETRRPSFLPSSAAKALRRGPGSHRNNISVKQQADRQRGRSVGKTEDGQRPRGSNRSSAVHHTLPRDGSPNAQTTLSSSAPWSRRNSVAAESQSLHRASQESSQLSLYTTTPFSVGFSPFRLSTKEAERCLPRALKTGGHKAL
ncbi:hypothetical protein AAFF_G00280120 [Aldrovandia affinis]|uniref:Uncharacterized protein n=1 Tax=Aldrovandia affinis TaxID=143900 RepID=A0AAD7RAA1_9TELE|nr:hypothetical protein AAFF_G00280120 [Aldrovandia affinis]